MAVFSREARIEWDGGVMDGAGRVIGGTGSFAIPATFPSMLGDPPGKTTPEEMLAASHAICYGIGLRSVIGRRGGAARRVGVSARITATKGPEGIRIRSSHLIGTVIGLEGITPDGLQDVARAAEDGCTISIVLRSSIPVTFEVSAATD